MQFDFETGTQVLQKFRPIWNEKYTTGSKIIFIFETQKQLDNLKYHENEIIQIRRYRFVAYAFRIIRILPMQRR